MNYGYGGQPFGQPVMMQGYGVPSPAYGMAPPQQQQYFPGVQMAPQGRPVHQQQWPFRAARAPFHQP
ncbi:hypothetical protein T484DRAFT_1817702 [Baffinella frigidus]|nr:hypothetical protein T484DRAFT_1817702 [Cryptophyta sp. CCMP2293]